MAKHSKRAQVVGGFDTFKAAQRAAREPPAQAPAPGQPGTPPGPKKIASRIDHTALPTKHEIRCYECGYEFQLTGRTPTTHCPKCRKMLEIKEYTIDGEWSETVRTAGAIHVTGTAVISEGELIATDIILEGQLDGGVLKAYRWLELGASATFAEKDVSGRDLRVAAGAEVVLRRKATYTNVELHGVLKAKLHASGKVTIKSTGFLQGELHAAHLCVEEGGGLKAKVRVAKSELVPEKNESEQLKKTA